MSTSKTITPGLANMAAHTLKANITGSSAAPVDSSLSAILDAEVGSTKGTLLVRGTSLWSPFPVGPDTQLIVADSTQTLGMKWAPAPSSAGITFGLDKDRPAASAGSIYQATDSKLTYLSDLATTWYVAGAAGDKVAFGGFSDSNFINSPFAGANIGPLMTNPYTILMGFYVISLPGATTQVVFCNLQTGFTDGWYLATSAANSNKFKFAMRGVNSSAENEFSGMTALTTGAHAVAISYDGSNLVLVCDGGSAQTIATTGSFTAPAASAKVRIGRYVNTGSSSPALAVSYVMGYSSALSTADKQALTTSPSNYFPGLISTAPVWGWYAKATAFGGTTLRTWGSATTTDGTSILAANGTLNVYTF